MQGILAKILAIFGGVVMQKVVKTLPQIIKAVEDDYKEALADGKITADERKKLVMLTVEVAVEQFGGKMSRIVKWGLSILVDMIAKKLPSKDLNINELVEKAKEMVGVA